MRSSPLFSLLFASFVACNGAAHPGVDGGSFDSAATDSASDSGPRDSGPSDSGSALDSTALDSSSDSGMCGGSLMQSASCEACLESMCCTEVSMCNATPGCPTVFECLHSCASGDGTCYTGCLSGMSGVGASSQVDGCILMHCPPSCRAM